MDIQKIVILQMLYKERPTIPEMAKAIDRSSGTVYNLLQDLVAVNLVTPPRKKGAARDYKITERGTKYLTENHYIKGE